MNTNLLYKKSYQYNDDTLNLINSFLDYGYNNFKNPYLFHFKCYIDINQFSSTNLYRYLNRKFTSIYHQNAKRRQSKRIYKAPTIKWFKSIELSQQWHKHPDGSMSNNYFHLHLYAMVNINTDRHNIFIIPEYIRNTINNINGLSGAVCLQRQNNQGWHHNLKTELDDAKDRMRYLAKIEQKPDMLYKLFKKTIGHSRINTPINTNNT